MVLKYISWTSENSIVIPLITFLFFYSLAEICQTKLEFKSDCHFKPNKWFTDFIHQKMLNATMQSNNENYQREEMHLFTFYSHNMNKEFQ